MKIRGLIGALSALVLGLAGVVVGANAAQATGPVAVESLCNVGWYVNHDEGGSDAAQGDRRPDQEVDGFSFEGKQLVHHAAPEGLVVSELEPGTFVAAPAPSLVSFFSVEVWDVENSAIKSGTYATLRWNTSTSKWDMVTDGQTYSHEDPAVLVTLPEVDKGSTVRSFGVGYVNNPATGTKTTVKSVMFAGKTYPLDCPQKPADKKVWDFKLKCDGLYVRPGVVTHTWNAEKRKWMPSRPTWGDWLKKRPLTPKEQNWLEDRCTPETPPATTPSATTPPATTAPPTSSPPTTEAPVPAGNETDDGGNLAKTGVPTLLIGGGGLALLTVGGLLMLLTIRRRRDDAAETAQFPAV